MAKTEKAEPDEVVAVTDDAPELTKDEVRERKRKLMEELASLPVDEEEIQGNSPGTIINRGLPTEAKVPWTMAAVRRLPTKTFIPPKSTKIIWNGIRIDVEAGVEVTIPEPHFNTFMESMRLGRVNDWQFQPLSAEERLLEHPRPHRMGFGGLDPRGGGPAAT